MLSAFKKREPNANLSPGLALTIAQTANENIRKETDQQTEHDYTNGENDLWNIYYAAILAAEKAYCDSIKQTEDTFRETKIEQDDTYMTTVIPAYIDCYSQLNDLESLFNAAISHAGDASFNAGNWFGNGIGNNGDYQSIVASRKNESGLAFDKSALNQILDAINPTGSSGGAYLFDDSPRQSIVDKFSSMNNGGHVKMIAFADGNAPRRIPQWVLDWFGGTVDPDNPKFAETRDAGMLGERPNTIVLPPYVLTEYQVKDRRTVFPDVEFPKDKEGNFKPVAEGLGDITDHEIDFYQELVDSMKLQIIHHGKQQGWDFYITLLYELTLT